MREIHNKVLRHDLSEPGFYWLDAGVLDSHELRRKMIEISKTFKGFEIYSMSRFDQQNTTKFHLDGGPIPNILVLGYEPSKVKSRLFLADHPCAANDIRVDPKALVTKAMFGKDEELQPYVTELPQPQEGHSYILFINNEAVLGVMHKAEIEKNPAELRMVNSIMLASLEGDHSRYTDEDLEEYIATDAHAAEYRLTT